MANAKQSAEQEYTLLLTRKCEKMISDIQEYVNTLSDKDQEALNKISNLVNNYTELYNNGYNRAVLSVHDKNVDINIFHIYAIPKVEKAAPETSIMQLINNRENDSYNKISTLEYLTNNWDNKYFEEVKKGVHQLINYQYAIDKDNRLKEEAQEYEYQQKINTLSGKKDKDFNSLPWEQYRKDTEKCKAIIKELNDYISTLKTNEKEAMTCAKREIYHTDQSKFMLHYQDYGKFNISVGLKENKNRYIADLEYNKTHFSPCNIEMKENNTQERMEAVHQFVKNYETEVIPNIKEAIDTMIEEGKSRIYIEKEMQQIDNIAKGLESKITEEDIAHIANMEVYKYKGYKISIEAERQDSKFAKSHVSISFKIEEDKKGLKKLASFIQSLQGKDIASTSFNINYADAGQHINNKQYEAIQQFINNYDKEVLPEIKKIISDKEKTNISHMEETKQMPDKPQVQVIDRFSSITPQQVIQPEEIEKQNINDEINATLSEQIENTHSLGQEIDDRKKEDEVR